MNREFAISVSRLTKTFPGPSGGKAGCTSTRALHDVSFQISAGERVALLGASGSGKSTLIRLLCGLESPDPGQGSIEIEGRPLFAAESKTSTRNIERARECCGVVFQQFNLVGQLSVLDNVMIGSLAPLPTWRIISRQFPRETRACAMDCLAQVGLDDRAHQRASTLSGGQQQRVAVARALAKGARILLADEPVASLDPESSRRVMQTLAELADQFGITLLISLHQTEIAKRYCSRAIALRTGELVFDGSTISLTQERLRALYGAQAEELLESDEPSISQQSEVVNVFA